LIWREIAGVIWRGIAGAHLGIAVAGEGGNGSVEVAARRRCLARDHHYPSGDECMSCHTRTAHFVLGANTRQWNREVAVGGGGHVNQLVLASRHGVLGGQITPEQAAGWKKLAAIDDARASVEERVRSYLDANCSQCHRPGVLVQVGLDARYDTPLAKQGLVRGPVRWPVVPHPEELMVVPKDPDRSRVYLRVRDHRMPPLGTLLPNTAAIDLLEKWILGLEGPPVLRAVKLRAEVSGGAVRVQLSQSDPAARIHYTTDGTIPSPETPRYTAPIELTRAAVVRAAAFRQGYGASRTTSIEVEPPAP
jgi:hypothetical protein